MKRFLLAWTLLIAGAAVCLGQEHGVASAGAGHEDMHAADPAPHPGVPENPTWGRPVVTLVLVLFLLAIPVGIFVRATMPEEMPPVHAHDEHHGHKDPHGDPGLGGHDPHAHDAHGHGH